MSFCFGIFIIPQNALTISYQKLCGMVKVVFFGTGMVTVNAIRSVAAAILSQETIAGLILVLQSHLTSQALKAIKLFSFKFEIFQLPRISKKYAIVRYHGLEKGQVVKMNYKGELTESHVAYQCVW